MAAHQQSDLTIIIVSWNVRELLATCLRSIEEVHDKQLSVEVIVVDASSEDDTLDMLAGDFPSVQAIATSENVGFSRGNNIGIAAAQGKYVLLLNPDTEVIGDALGRMVAFMDANEKVGVVGPQLLDSDRVTVQSSRRRFPTLALAFFESTWLQRLASRSMLKRYYVLDLPDDETAHVDWVVGAALMTRRAVLDEVGGLDEGYFMYSEEMDWCHRVKDAGWQVVYLPEAQVMHHGGKSSEQVIAEQHIHFQQSKLRYFGKYHSSVSALALRVFLMIQYCYQLLLEAAKGLVGHKRNLRRERVRAYWRVLRSGLRG